MKDIRQFIQITSGLAEPLRQGFLLAIDDYEKRLVIMSKDEAIAFATKYLGDRKDQYVICSWCAEPLNELHGKHVSCEWGLERAKAESVTSRPWNCAVEYLLLDIIPYLFGEALD